MDVTTLTILPSNVTWTLAGLVGLLVGIVSVTESFKDLSAARRGAYEPVKATIAGSTVLMEVVRMLAQGLLFLTGVVSFFTPKPLPEHEMLGNIFAVVAILLASNSVIGLVSKRRLLKLITARRRKAQ